MASIDEEERDFLTEAGPAVAASALCFGVISFAVSAMAAKAFLMGNWKGTLVVWHFVAVPISRSSQEEGCTSLLQ